MSFLFSGHLLNRTKCPLPRVSAFEMLYFVQYRQNKPKDDKTAMVGVALQSSYLWQGAPTGRIEQIHPSWFSAHQPSQPTRLVSVLPCARSDAHLPREPWYNQTILEIQIPQCAASTSQLTDFAFQDGRTQFESLQSCSSTLDGFSPPKTSGTSIVKLWTLSDKKENEPI